MKYGLTLEGGGARGAYHIGAVKALVDNGYEFDMIVGTSIGAINAAFLAQNDLDKVYKMWQELSFKDMFDIDEEKIKDALNVNLDVDTIKYLSRKLAKTVKEKGIDTLKIRKILEDAIDEEKVRKSKIKFGLVTYCLSDANGEEKLIDDIEKGKLIDYIMASSNLPVFQRTRINDKNYLDGGVYDNCPVSLLESQGIKEAIVIRTYKWNRIRGYKDIVKRGNVNMHMLSPVDKLPSILNFDSKNLNNLLKLGYFDALKMINSLDGIRYYINPVDEEYLLERLSNIPYDVIEKIAKKINLKLEIGKNISDILKDDVITILSNKLKNKNVNTSKEYIISILEYVADKVGVKKYKVYDFDDFLNEIKDRIKEGKYKKNNDKDISNSNSTNIIKIAMSKLGLNLEEYNDAMILFAKHY